MQIITAMMTVEPNEITSAVYAITGLVISIVIWIKANSDPFKENCKRWKEIGKYYPDILMHVNYGERNARMHKNGYVYEIIMGQDSQYTISCTQKVTGYKIKCQKVLPRAYTRYATLEHSFATVRHLVEQEAAHKIQHQ